MEREIKEKLSTLRPTKPCRSTIFISIIMVIFHVIYFLVGNRIAPQRDYVRMPCLFFIGTYGLLLFVIARNIRYQLNKKSNLISLFALIIWIVYSNVLVREIFSQSTLAYSFWLSAYEHDIIPVCEWDSECRFTSQLARGGAGSRCNEQYCLMISDTSYLDENIIIVARLKNYNPKHNLEYFIDIERPNVEYIANVGPLVVYNNP